MWVRRRSYQLRIKNKNEGKAEAGMVCGHRLCLQIQMIKKSTLKKNGKYYLYFLRWIAIAVVLGAVGGTIGSIFHHCIDEVTLLRGEFPWLLYLLPGVGLVIVFIYRKAGLEKDPGTNWVLTSTQTEDTVPRRMLPLIFISTIFELFLSATSIKISEIIKMKIDTKRKGFSFSNNLFYVAL